jgi:hypothetical protein
MRGAHVLQAAAHQSQELVGSNEAGHGTIQRSTEEL